MFENNIKSLSKHKRGVSKLGSDNGSLFDVKVNKTDVKKTTVRSSNGSPLRQRFTGDKSR
jgi:hypothetical protein